MDTLFSDFLTAIKLTPSERADAKTKYDGVCSKLHSYYYPNTTYNGDTRLLIGSYGKRTHIRPARDVDVIFVMPPDKFAQYADNRANPQSQLLQDVRSILLEKYPNTPIRAWGKVVRLEFSSPNHQVDLLPAWEQANGTFLIPNSENNGSWDISDPRAEIERIQNSHSQTSKTRPLIRMIKKWAGECTVNLSSYEIEQSVLSYINSSHSNISYSQVVNDFFGYFKNISTGQVQSHLSTAHGRAIKACEFENKGDMLSASAEWIKIFGTSFPQALKNSSDDDVKMIEALQRQYPSSAEQFIDRDFGFNIELKPGYSLTIDTVVTKANGFRPGGRLSDLTKSFKFFKLLKRIDVNFEVTNINVPSPYQLYWKIRNFGDEAQRVNKLRGEITQDYGFRQKKESTLYPGTHLVECYAIKDNACVAIGRLFVPIGNDTE